MACEGTIVDSISRPSQSTVLEMKWEMWVGGTWSARGCSELSVAQRRKKEVASRRPLRCVVFVAFVCIGTSTAQTNRNASSHASRVPLSTSPSLISRILIGWSEMLILPHGYGRVYLSLYMPPLMHARLARAAAVLGRQQLSYTSRLRSAHTPFHRYGYVHLCSRSLHHNGGPPRTIHRIQGIGCTGC